MQKAKNRRTTEGCTQISGLKKEILNTLLYFDLFKHPLTLEEVHYFLQSKVSIEALQSALGQLEQEKLIFKDAAFFALNNIPENFQRKKEAQARAIDKMEVALKNSSYIASIPFVRAAFLSGTISKGVMYEDSDIDYFIITANGRVWVTKFFMKLFKTFFLLNDKSNFCYNYLISEDSIGIQEQNLYTATELVSLIPTYNYDLYNEFLEQNEWSKTVFPNFTKRTDEHISNTKPRKIKAILESMFGGKIGDWLDNKYMTFVQNNYKKKYKDQLTQEEMNIALRSTKKSSKVHPQHYQKRFLNRYMERKETFLAQKNIELV